MLGLHHRSLAHAIWLARSIIIHECLRRSCRRAGGSTPRRPILLSSLQVSARPHLLGDHRSDINVGPSHKDNTNRAGKSQCMGIHITNNCWASSSCLRPRPAPESTLGSRSGSALRSAGHQEEVQTTVHVADPVRTRIDDACRKLLARAQPC